MELIFDDIITRGNTLDDFKAILEHHGAHVICACFIGRTVRKDIHFKNINSEILEHITRGNTLDDFKAILEHHGAHVICACFIGRTVRKDIHFKNINSEILEHT